jgi:hypothetical protein
MSHDLENAGIMSARSGKLGREKLKQLLILSLLAIAVTGCGLSTSLEVRAYNTCAGRHPQELAVCEGPRQAYELNPTAFEAKAAAISSPAGSSIKQLSPAPSLAPRRSIPARSPLVETGRRASLTICCPNFSP